MEIGRLKSQVGKGTGRGHHSTQLSAGEVGFVDAHPAPLPTLMRGTHTWPRMDERKYFLSPAVLSFHDTNEDPLPPASLLPSLHPSLWLLPGRKILRTHLES